jgi:hypothetical protein
VHLKFSADEVAGFVADIRGVAPEKR